jgi:hypothetical protein
MYSSSQRFSKWRRVLRAQLGTTKYCSAYLRNEICTNKNCMFLHEPGDNDDSYSRQDLSSINSVNTQRPLPIYPWHLRLDKLPRLRLQSNKQPVAAAAQPMARDNSKDGSDSGDGSALPSSASWANRGTQQRSRRGSHATSGANSSPAVSHSMPATAEAVEEAQDAPEEQAPEPASVAPSDSANSTEPARPVRNPVLIDLLRAINSPTLSYTGSSAAGDDLEIYSAFRHSSMIAVARNEELCESIKKKPGCISTKSPKQSYNQLPSRLKRKSNPRAAVYSLVASLRTGIMDEKAISHKDSMAHDDLARNSRSSELQTAVHLAQVYHRTFHRTSVIQFYQRTYPDTHTTAATSAHEVWSASVWFHGPIPSRNGKSTWWPRICTFSTTRPQQTVLSIQLRK